MDTEMQVVELQDKLYKKIFKKYSRKLAMSTVGRRVWEVNDLQLDCKSVLKTCMYDHTMYVDNSE